MSEFRPSFLLFYNPPLLDLPEEAEEVIPFPEGGDSLGESEGVEVSAKPYQASPGPPLAVPGRAWPAGGTFGSWPRGLRTRQLRRAFRYSSACVVRFAFCQSYALINIQTGPVG